MPNDAEVLERLNRAIVRCTVAVESPAGDKRFGNLRLFAWFESSWRLLARPNEPLETT
jgi:hypothetical protein